MAFERFNVPKELIKLTPEQVLEYSAAAEGLYSSEMPYHGWGHATEVAEGVDVIADKLERQGITIARGALKIAGFWHDVKWHEDHIAKGYPTKELYSAALLDKYLKGKPVSEFERSLMLRAIVGTWAGFYSQRLPDELVLHRSDIGGIGGDEAAFLDASRRLHQEAKLFHNPNMTWEEYVKRNGTFIEFTAHEHDYESLLNNTDPDNTTVDLNDVPFRQQAFSNLRAMQDSILS